MTAGAPPPPAPRPRPRHRGLFWLATLISVMALVGGGYLAVTDYLKAPPPGEVALTYFKAVARGDAARALSYGAVPEGNRAYLTAAVLKQQLAVGHIEQLKVASVASSGDTAKVTISYSLRAPSGAARSTLDVVPMTRKDRRWSLTQSAVTTKVAITQATNRATFAGTAFPASDVVLFPGALPITFDTPDLEVGASATAVQFSESDNSRIVVEPSAAGIAAARTAVSSLFQGCLDGTSTDPYCPTPTVALPQRPVPSSLRGTAAAKSSDGFAVTVTANADGRLQAKGVVHVDGHYQVLSYANVASTVTNNDIAVTVSATCYLTPSATAAGAAATSLVAAWRTP